jgi:hypothetical protein
VRKIKLEKYQSALNLAKSNLDRHLDKLVNEGLNIENEFLRDTLVEKIKNEIEKQVSNDTMHMRRMQSLWLKAEENDFDNRSLSRIINAYLERARPIVNPIRNRFKAQLSGKATQDKSEDVKMVKGKSGKISGDGKINMKLVDPRKIDYSQTSDDDILSGKIKLRS